MFTQRKLIITIFIFALILVMGVVFFLKQSGEVAIRPANISDPILYPVIVSLADEIDNNPSNRIARLQLGMTYEGARMYALAEVTYRQITEQFSDQVVGWYRLAVVQQKQGKIEEAIQSLLEATELAGPKLDAPHWQLAFWYIDEGDLDSASRQIALADSKRPNSNQVQIAKGRIALAKDNPELAIEILSNDRLISSIPDGYVYQLLGRAYRAFGDEEKSREAWSRAGQSKPNWPDPWSHLVKEHTVGLNVMRQEIFKQLRAKKVFVARKLIDEYFTYDKENRDIRRLDAQCNSMNGKIGIAINKYLNLIKEDSRDVVTMILLARSRLKVKQFRTEEELLVTKNILLKVLEISKDNTQAKLLLELLQK